LSPWRVLTLLLALLCGWMLFIDSSRAADRAQLLATEEAGYGRLVFTFPDRIELPPYKIKYDNGVLAIEFESPVSIALPDMSATMPGYATIARQDPDGKGVRFGLRAAFSLNHMEAGEKLFVDLMPANWQGLPPALPPEVVAQLVERAKNAAIIAEQQRKAEEAKTLKPVATVRMGRNPTFIRMQFDWNVDTKAKFDLKPGAGTLTFDWPVPVDLYEIKADLPKQLKSAGNTVDASGSKVTLQLADGVVPRFYELSPRNFVVDFDIAPQDGLKRALAAEEAARKQASEAADAAAATANHDGQGTPDAAHGNEAQGDMAATASITPQVTTAGNTVRISFPFAKDTASAVFRRGDTVWMVFDTAQSIAEPPASAALSSVASSLKVVAAGDTKVVRLDLAADRLATLGSEGRAWVLSLGDVLLNATEPVTLERSRGEDGHYVMTADLQRPGTVHMLRDPVVGDTLRVVTVMPPARGLVRELHYVDFDALQSAHGLVIKPLTDSLDVTIEDKLAQISSKDGLVLSTAEAARTLDAGNAPDLRESYLDLGLFQEQDLGKLAEKREELIAKASSAEGRLRDVARIELANLLVANQLSYEALGVMDVAEKELSSEDQRRKLTLSRAIADTLAGRSADALAILNANGFPDQSDALMWRTMARADAGDFVGARADALASEPVVESYPAWIRQQFQFAALRAAVETNDTPMALRLIGEIEFAKLDPEQVSLYELMQGRIAELEGHAHDALDSYGKVISTDVRPTRAEAVYRTLLMLEKSGDIDLGKATETLAAEAMTWRGGRLEADMQKLLAELYFKHKDYRLGFDTVKQASASFPDSGVVGDLIAGAAQNFEDLYLNGAADALDDVSALSLYYDFREFTPPGARGDEMIRNLVRRLVKAGLLTQAGDLLEYQVDSRLAGVAKAQVAADLAIIRIADRDPESALRVLNRTRMADLSPLLDRQRRVLEARALIDSGRQDLALDLISKLSGKDADLLRVDGYWKSKNYAMAAELLEVLYTPQVGAPQMTKAERMNVIKAAVGFVLAGDKIGLSRLRTKLGDQMANSAEWPIFDFVTRDIAPQSAEFRQALHEVSGIDPLDAFLTTYRAIYADGGMAPRGAKAPNAA
jgi:hypothetical protein